MKRFLCVVFSFLLILLLFAAAENTFAAEPVYNGLSGYPTSTADVQNVINFMNREGLNVYRMSFRPSWLGYTSHSYNGELVSYFLDHCSYTVIVDRNHLYPPSDPSFITDFNTATNDLLAVCAQFPNNNRVMVELVNEYGDDNLGSLLQPMVNSIRNAGYTNPLVINSHWISISWSSLVVNDPLDKVWYGYHTYFDDSAPSISSVESHMQTAVDMQLKLINTEAGADWESADFNTARVNLLNQYLSWCTARGIGNCIWMYENLNYWTTYQSLGLIIPSGTSPTPSSTPTASPSPSPSASPSPSPSPTPTATPTPNLTPTPSPSSLPTSTPNTPSFSQNAYDYDLFEMYFGSYFRTLFFWAYW